MLRTIPLTQGKVAVVDDEDFERLARHKWHATKHRNTWYACRSITVGGRHYIIYMHREITGAPNGVEVDHWDWDGLNNTRANLRLCTHAENIAHSRPFALRKGPARACGNDFEAELRAKSPYGFSVYEHTQRRGRWVGQIRVEGKTKHVGCFDSREEALLAIQEVSCVCVASPCVVQKALTVPDSETQAQ